MPSQVQHETQAQRNETFFQSLDRTVSVNREWIVTAAFYAALHWIEAYFDNRHRQHFTSHRDRNNAVIRFGLPLASEYLGLYWSSRQARDDLYRPTIRLRARLKARLKARPHAFGTGPRSNRVSALVAEAAKASGIGNIQNLVDVILYTTGYSSFDVIGGTRILAIGSTMFRRTKAGQLMEAAHELVHAQQWAKTLKRFGGNETAAYHGFFTLKPFGSRGYAFDEVVAERLARMRMRRYLGGLSSQQEGVSTRYINEWRVLLL